MTESDATTRRTVAHFPSDVSATRSDWRLELNGYMFFEDVRLQIMPVGGRTRSFPEFSIQADPDSPEVQEQLTFIFGSSERGYRRNLTEVISQYASQLAARLAFNPSLTHEIGSIHLQDSKRNRSLFRKTKLPLVLPIPLRIPGRVINIGPIAIQLIPAREWSQSGHKFVLLRRNQVWRVAIPKELGGALKYRVMQRFIAETNELMPRYITRSKLNPYEERNLNLLQFLGLRQKLLCAATSNWSWPARMSWRDQVTEYFLVERQLAFSERLAVLRMHALHSMNEFLEKSQFGAKLKLSGLPSPADVSDSVASLREGNLGFEKALDLSHI